jgi:hypothetical protein
MGEPELLAAPVVSSVAPTSGLPETATAVTITGTGFTGATSVTFGGEAATTVVVVSDTSITCHTPANVGDATVGVTVVTPGGSNTLLNGFTFTGGTGTTPTFPAFTPIYPPPAVGVGGGATPAFPPPTPPPIGHVPVGPLVGPAIAPAAVPPSVAGVVQPQYKTGSATVPTAASLFPEFTTTTAYAGFPNNPPTGVPIVFSNIYTGGNPQVTPPSTPTTAQITLNGASNLTPHLGSTDVGVLMQDDEERNHRTQPKRRADRRREQHF